MRNVWRVRNVTFASLLALAALLVLLGGGDEAKALPVPPDAYSFSVGPPTAADAPAPVTQSVALPNHFPDQLVMFTPCKNGTPITPPSPPGECWGVGEGASILIGDSTGSALAVVTMGFLNAPCAVPVPLALPLINASVDTSVTIGPVANFINLVSLTGGIPDGAQSYSTVLLDAETATPLQRSYGQIENFLGLGVNIVLDVVTYSPGVFTAAPSDFGTLFLIETFSPDAPPFTSVITDTCGLSVSITNPAFTGGGSHLRINPSGGTYKFLAFITVPSPDFHAVLLDPAVCITGGPFVDGDGDGFCGIDELALGSDPTNDASTPENIAFPTTCSDGVDNDGDGSADLADPGCQLPDHDIAIRKITGDAVAGGTSDCQPNAPTGCGYNIILRNNTSAVEQGQVGVLVDPLPGAGCSGPTAVLHGGSAKPVLAAGSGPINIDGDTDVEFLLTVDVTIPANGQATVNVGVVYPTCAPPAVPGTPADYFILADLCHADDIAPLGLFAIAACGGSADGGQDRVNLANDAPVIKVINDVNR